MMNTIKSDWVYGWQPINMPKPKQARYAGANNAYRRSADQTPDKDDHGIPEHYTNAIEGSAYSKTIKQIIDDTGF